METMNEKNMETCPLSMDAEWCPLVNNRADKAEEDRRKHSNWLEQQEAKRRAELRAQRIMRVLAMALALIVAGGIGMNYVEGFPMWIAVSIAGGGMAIYCFVIGWLFGNRARR